MQIGLNSDEIITVHIIKSSWKMIKGDFFVPASFLLKHNFTDNLLPKVF